MIFLKPACRQTENSQASKILILIGCIIFSISAQAQYFIVKDSLIDKDLNINHPFFSKNKSGAIADSINASLNDHLPGIPPKEDGLPGGVSEMMYGISRNDEIALSITVYYQACGVYCETVSEYYFFDSKTGKPFVTGDLFTGEGVKILLDSVTSLQRDTINSYLKAMPRIQKPDSLLTEEERDRNSIYDILAGCASPIDPANINYIGFEIRDKDFTIILGRCSYHAIMALDPFLEYRFTFTAKGWRRYMTDYGKHIFRL